jgi:hypothetical protein
MAWTAWTFPNMKAVLPQPNELSLTLAAFPKFVWQQLLVELATVDVTPSLQDTSTCRISAHGDTWSRAARRQKARGVAVQQDQLALVADLRVADAEQGAVISLTWRHGFNRQLFESLWSHLLRSVQSKPP